MGALTSPLGHGFDFTGFTLAVGTGGSPEPYTPIANIQDFNLPATSVVVDDTNSADQFVSRQPTILDLGKITFKIFWFPKETSHYNGSNGAPGSGVASGLRYLWRNKVLVDFQAQYPDGSVDNFQAYVTDFAITGKVKDKFMANVTLSNSGPASLC